MSESIGSRGQSEGLRPIGEVVAALRQTYPDVTHSSLRFLEREGIVEAVRTPGGHRLYAPADIERIRQVKTWQAQRLSLEDVRQRLAALDRLPPPAALAETFLQQALGADLAAAYRTIVAADDVGMPLVQIFGDVLQPALTEVGRRWADGTLLVAQEKEITELAREIIAELSLRHARSEPDGPVLVAACVEGERHELGLRMVCGLFRSEGWAVHYLGADVAPRFLQEAVRLHRPAVILLSAKLSPTLPAVKATLDVLSAGLSTEPPPPVVVGGRVAVEHADELRGWGAIPVADEHPAAAIGTVASVLQPPVAAGSRNPSAGTHTWAGTSRADAGAGSYRHLTDCDGAGTSGEERLMCLDCGCGDPNERHGDDRHITMDDVKAAAEASEILVDEAARNPAERLR